MVEPNEESESMKDRELEDSAEQPPEEPLSGTLICPLCSERVSGETTSGRAEALKVHLQECDT
jgi:hypothetical protein